MPSHFKIPELPRDVEIVTYVDPVFFYATVVRMSCIVNGQKAVAVAAVDSQEILDNFIEQFLAARDKAIECQTL